MNTENHQHYFHEQSNKWILKCVIWLERYNRTCCAFICLLCGIHEIVSTIAVCMQVLDFDVACLDESRLVVTSLTFSLTR